MAFTSSKGIESASLTKNPMYDSNGWGFRRPEGPNRTIAKMAHTVITNIASGAASGATATAIFGESEDQAVRVSIGAGIGAAIGLVLGVSSIAVNYFFTLE